MTVVSDVIEKRTSLMIKIIDGKVDKSFVRKEIEKLENQYGENAFLPYIVKKKDKPWDEKYLKELEIQGMAGAASKEFILHLAEVSESVYRKKRLKKAFLIGAAALALAAIITTALILIAGKDVFNAAVIAMTILIFMM